MVVELERRRVKILFVLCRPFRVHVLVMDHIHPQKLARSRYIICGEFYGINKETTLAYRYVIVDAHYIRMHHIKSKDYDATSYKIYVGYKISNI